MFGGAQSSDVDEGYLQKMTETPTPRRTARQRIADIPLPFYLMPLLLFVVIPAVIARENDISISRIPLSAGGKLVTMAILVFLGLIVVRSIVSLARGRAAFESTIEFVFFFIVVTGFVFPVASSAGMVEASNTDINLIHLAVGLGLASVMALVAHVVAKGRETLYWMLLLFVALNTGFIVLGEAALSNDIASATNASSSNSIFVLSFDGIPGSAVSEVLAEDSDLENDFDGFVLYQEVASSSPATSASIAAELLGNQNFKDRHDTEDEVWNSSPERLFTNVLATHGYEVTTYGEYSRNSIDQSHEMRPSTLSGRTASNLLKLSLARSLSRAFVPRGRPANWIEAFLHAPTPSETASETDLISSISDSQSPEWSKDLGMSMIDFYRYVDQLVVDDGPSTAHFLHFTHTHYPVEIDSECAFRGDDALWYELNQNREGVVAETRCALSQFGFFVDKLRELGIYDQSIVVLKSDHGKPVEYGGPGTIESLAIKEHGLWGYGRYAPFLAIKPRFSEIRGLDRDRTPVLLDDLAKTLCIESGITYDCNQYQGYNIVRESDLIAADAWVTLFVVDSSASDFRFDTHVPVRLTRGEGVLDSLHSELTQSNGSD
jgi:hypothetical protein